jgi:hypothetical protein
MTGIPRWAILLLGAGLVLFGIAVSQGWIRDPALAKADYVGTIDVSAEDAKLYRAVPFEWRVTSAAAPSRAMIRPLPVALRRHLESQRLFSGQGKPLLPDLGRVCLAGRTRQRPG